MSVVLSMMPGSVGTTGLQMGKVVFVINPEKGWLRTDAWVGDPSANTASVANTW